MTDELQLMKAVDNTLGIFLAFDYDMAIVYASKDAKKKLGYGDELVGMSIDIIFPWVNDDDGIEKFEAALKKGRTNLVVYRKNSTCFSAEARISRIHPQIKYNEELKPMPDMFPNRRTEYIMSIIDLGENEELIKKIHQTEELLEKQSEKKDEFLANITHELKTPLNGIKGHVKAIKDMGLSENQLTEVRIVERCCDNMEKIILNFLDYSKMSAGKFTLSNEIFSIKEIVNHAIDTNIKQANQKDIKLIANISPTVPAKVFGDPLRFGQILNNLISNAVKFTDVGSVTVDITEVQRGYNDIEIFVMVIDTGIGIDDAGKDKLFKSFSQVDGSITRKYGGTGLGLAVTKGLVEMMGGQIRVESTYGKGSSFSCSVKFKLEEENEETAKRFEAAKNAIELEEDAEPDSISANVRNERFRIKISEELQLSRENMDMKTWGSYENRQEFSLTLEKIILCIEMRAWEKAETLAQKLNHLTKGADLNIAKKIFSLALAIRKEDYDQSIKIYDEVLVLLNIDK